MKYLIIVGSIVLLTACNCQKKPTEGSTVAPAQDNQTTWVNTEADSK